MQRKFVVRPNELIDDDVDQLNKVKAIDEAVKEHIMNRVLNGELMQSIKPKSDTSWGPPNNWYTAPGDKFLHKYATVSPEEWVKFHDSINHSRAGATKSTVKRVKRDIENDEVSNIPTPPLALSPEKFNENPLTYTVDLEGRSRGLGALKAGIDEMPIVIAIRRPRL